MRVAQWDEAGVASPAQRVGVGPEAGPARLRSNSFNLTPLADIAWPVGAPCPLRGRHPGHDRYRTLLLRLTDRVRLCETHTGDFDQAELELIKERHGQLYVDISRKLAPDDFARDLRKLQELAECKRCADRPRCGSAWQATSANVFERDEASLLALLGNLRGRVLDVGCGDGPYLHSLRPLVEARHVEYCGIDPDAGRLAVLASRHPWASFRALGVDALTQLGDARFDHVLFLRSFNHLERPRAAVEAALALLTQGGTLTLVDNVAFGLVRQATTARRAEAGPAEHEHYRNVDAAGALRVLRGLPLRILRAAEVSPATSNQWLVHLSFDSTCSLTEPPA